MSGFEDLRALFGRRLLAAARRRDLTGRTRSEYEEELHNQGKLLDVILTPEIKLHRADVQQLLMSEEERHPEEQEWSPSLGQEETDLAHIKEEQEEPWNSQDGEQLQGLEEADNGDFPFNIVVVKSEDDEEKAQSLTKQTEIGADGEDCGGAESVRNSDPETHSQSENEIKTEDFAEPVIVNGADDRTELTGHQAGLDQVENTENKRAKNNKKSHSCSECHKTFKTRHNLTTHIRIHTGEKPFSCTVCGKRFNQTGHLTEHMIVHTGEKPFSCSVCGKRFNQTGHLNKHMLVHTGEKPFSCSVCRKQFKHNSSLSLHMAYHRGEKPFGCVVCAQRFSWRTQLRKHKCVGYQASDLHQTQTEEKKEATIGVGEDFGGPESARNSDLERHLQPETEVTTEESSERDDRDVLRLTLAHPLSINSVENTEIKRTLFDKKFTQTFKKKQDPAKHIKIHIEETPLCCSVCGQGFNRKGNLNRLMLAHKGEKLSSCPVCHKRLNRKGHLTRHMLVHSGEKPFICSFCSKRFNQKSSLRRHMLCHWGEKPYYCTVCGQRFSWYYQLKRHKCFGFQALELHQNQKVDIKEAETEAGGEDCGGTEAARSSNPETLLQSQNEVKTEESSDAETENSDDWREARESQSGSNSVENVKNKRPKNNNKKSYSCSQCGKTFSMKRHLTQHSRFHTGEKPFCCSFCGKRFYQKWNLTTHILVHTGEQPFGCSVCRRRFKHKSSLKLHMAHHRGEKPYSCSICEQSFPWLKQLKKHKCIHVHSLELNQLQIQKKREAETGAAGEDCGGEEEARSSNRETHLQQEAEVKTEDSQGAGYDQLEEQEPLVQMPQSSVDFSQVQFPALVLFTACNPSLSVHRFPVSLGLPYQTKANSPNNNLKKSQKTEESPEPEHENSCNDRSVNIDHMPCFNSGENFKNSTLETDKKLHHCSECDRTFNTKRHLTQHMRIHTGEQPFSCSECGKKFNQKGNLTTHMLVHTGEKPFSCPVCSKSFMLKGNLTKHMIIHTGKKPFSCSECGKRFYQQGNLTSHMFIHMGEKPFSCSVCGKQFREKGNLNRHNKTHTGERALQKSQI